MIVESFQENVKRMKTLWSRPIGVPPLQSRTYKLVSHIGPHMALNLVNKQVEGTAQYLSGVVVSAFAFGLTFVFTVSTAAHLECMELALSILPFVHILNVVHQVLKTLRELFCSFTARAYV